MKVAESARPKLVALRVQKELLRFSELKRNVDGYPVSSDSIRDMVGSGSIHVPVTGSRGELSGASKTSVNKQSVDKPVRSNSNDSSATIPCEDGKMSKVQMSFKVSSINLRVVLVLFEWGMK